MEEKIYCKIHSNEYYENYCEECKELICPHCALSQKHFSHIAKVKSLEEIIKQKIKGIDDFKNFSLYKTTELFQFIINYNSLFFPFDNSYIINSINDQFDKYIQKIIELKFQVINLFSKKFELMSNILQSTKKTVLETQNKLLGKIGGSNDSNNEYLNKLNMYLEKIRINKNPNEAMNFIGEYQNLINECFENNEDLNKKYNFYLAYKYLNDISFSFKDKFFDKLILPNFKNALSQIEDLIKKLNIEEKKDYEDFKSKLKELNIGTEITKEQIKIEKNKDNKEELKSNKENNFDKKEQNNNYNVKDKNKEIIEPNNNKKENEKEESKQNKEKKEEIIEVGEKDKEKKKEKEKEKEKIKENNNVNNQNKDDKDKNNENLKKENEKKEKENSKEKEREEFKKMLDNKNKQKKSEKNDNCNIEFEPPKIEGGKMTQEEINNLKEEEEEKFLKKESEIEDKEIGSSLFESKMVEKTELEIAKKIIDELDEDRLDIQYYEGIKFPDDDEKGGTLDNAYLEDNENKNEIKDNENKIEIKENENKNKNEIKESEVKENINKNEKGKDEAKDIKEEEKKEIKNNEKENQDKLKNNNNKPKESLNELFGIKDNSSKNKNEDKNKNKNKDKEKEKDKNTNNNNNQKDKIEKEKPLFDLDQWVNIESEPKVDNNKKGDKNKGKIVTKNPTSFSNVFGVKPESQNQKKQKDEKEKEKEKEIIYQEPKLTAPNNLESIEKLRKLYNIINSGGRNNPEYNSLFNSLTWEEKNYIEIIGLKSSDSTAFVYNQISDTIENIDTKIKFPSHQSYINVHPYVYLSGGKDGNKPINLIRRLRKINNFFKLEELGNLKEARSHHSTIYVKSMNSLIFISGSKTKTCEKFNLTKKQIESFPSVRNAREKCGTCLENDENLYIFFGFDKAKSKFETTVERINLNKSKSWEVLLIIGDQNLLKRQSMACIPFNMKNGKGIIITGGVGNLRNESDDTIYIDLEKNNVNKFNFLPFGASFTNPNFLPLTLGVEPKIIYNITNENKIISFNLENYSFSGIEYKEK